MVTSTSLKSLRDDAISFKTASERCFEHRKLSENSFQMCVVPGVVNIAFSPELFLKFILDAKSIKRGNEHKLLHLYNLLDEPNKLAIINLTEFKREIFEQLINEHSSLFVEWRYIHEQLSGNAKIGFMQQLASALEITAKKILI